MNTTRHLPAEWTGVPVDWGLVEDWCEDMREILHDSRSFELWSSRPVLEGVFLYACRTPSYAPAYINSCDAESVKITVVLADVGGAVCERIQR